MPIDISSRFPQALKALKAFWGYDAFRSGQDIAVQSVLKGDDTLVLFPTGGGKSLCYQVPAMVFDGLTLVISPLVALMEDQVTQLRRNGISAEFVNSTISRHEVEQRVTNARNGMYRLLYVAPERLQTPLFQHELASLNIELIAVDEAHCISEWGHEFRPSYRQIREWVSSAGIDPRWLALTATATPRVRNDIIESLAFKDPVVVTKTFERSNLRWWVMPATQKMQKLRQLLSRSDGSGLIYAGTRRECAQLAESLRGMGITAEAYHAGLHSDERKRIQDAWIHDTIPWVVATNAFGMGIDKPNCRYVIHWATPGSIEAYYQEAGRAGRDGKQSFPLLLWSQSDIERLRKQTEQSHPDRNILHKVYSGICDTFDLALGTMHDEAHVIDPTALSKRTDVPLKMIHYVLQALDRYGVITMTDRYPEAVGMEVISSLDMLCKPSGGKNPAKDLFGDRLARLFGADALGDMHFIELTVVIQKLGINRNALIKGLEVFRRDGHIRYELRDGKPLIQLLEPRQPRVPVSREAVDQYRKLLLSKLEFMEGYALTSQCRSMYLRRYFGEENVPDNCGNCDICLSKKRDESGTVSEDVKQLVNILGDETADTRSLQKALGWSLSRLQKSLSWLASEGIISTDKNNPGQIRLNGYQK